MKPAALIVLVLACLPAWAAPPVIARSGSVEVEYDGQLRRQLRWLPAAKRSIVAFDPAFQEGIRAGGVECVEWQTGAATPAQRRIEDPEFGPAQELTISGRCSRPGVVFDRQSRVLLPERFPNVALFQTSYRNAGGKRQRIEAVYSQRVLLDRKLADPDEDSWNLASFQGGAYKWGRDYALIWLKPDFRQSNFQGLDDRTGPEGEGGGMPFVDVWSPTMGVAIAHIEKTPQWLSLPVEVRADRKTAAAIVEQPSARLKQQEWLDPGQTYDTVLTAVIFHRGDYYDALSQYADLLRSRGIAIPRTSPDTAYEPYWKSWGFEFDFTVDKIMALLPQLKSMGIHIANLDDGWFDWYGDWNPLRKPGKFPAGEADMKKFVADIHARGFKSSIWWYPLGVSPESRLKAGHAALLVQNEKGEYPVDDRKVHQLCPGYGPARDYIASLVRRFMGDWDFDGVYVDSVGLTAVPPCFNPAHHHASPLESFQSLPKMFETIEKTAREMKPNPYVEVCVCAMPHSLYNMPYYYLGSASDPVNLFQMRRRVKIEKAIRGPNAAAGDCYQVPLPEWKGSSVPESFESAFGTGAQVATFFASLDDERRLKWQHWFHMYNRMELSKAEYLNLYDIAFDKPEGHAVRKGGETYYGFFADVWPVSRAIQLRGLDPGKTYDVYDYANGRSLGTVSGASPRIKHAFKDSLLLRVTPR